LDIKTRQISERKRKIGVELPDLRDLWFLDPLGITQLFIMTAKRMDPALRSAYGDQN
jgi:hypothetical protein